MSHERLLRRRLRTLATLDEAVAALRSLSAQHFRAARAPLEAVRAYRAEVERFLPALATRAPEPGPAGIVLVAADLGLVGDYSARLAREALALRAELGPGPLLCLGRRALPTLARDGVAPAWVGPAPARVGGVTAALLPLVDELLALRGRAQLGPLWLVAARFEGAGRYTPARVRVLPVAPPHDAAPLPVSPWCAPARVRAVVVREYLHAVLFETLVEAIASEHGKRLVTAQSARSWLDERMGAVRRRLASLRRESSTQEVLEIAVAARAAGAAGSPP